MFKYYSLGQFFKWGHSSQARLNIIFFWGRILPGLCVCLSTYPKYALAKIENFGGLRNPLKNPENSKNKNVFILYFQKKQLFCLLCVCKVIGRRSWRKKQEIYTFSVMWTIRDCLSWKLIYLIFPVKFKPLPYVLSRFYVMQQEKFMKKYFFIYFKLFWFLEIEREKKSKMEPFMI